jgi:hypothetical protein
MYQDMYDAPSVSTKPRHRSMYMRYDTQRFDLSVFHFPCTNAIGPGAPPSALKGSFSLSDVCEVRPCNDPFCPENNGCK